jgi:hypothetical protein
MNILVKSALAGVVLVIAYACANPVEIEGDVLKVDPSAFGDAGVTPAAAGGPSGAAQSGTGAGIAGSGLSAGSTGVGGAGTGSSMQAAAQTGALPVGTGGTRTGVGGATAQGGTGSVPGGAGGVPAAAGTGGTPAAAGTGGTGAQGTGPAVFDPASCDFDDTSGCEDLTCLAACSTTDGGYCRTSCQTLVTCVTTDPACTITAADPLCAVRAGGTPTACTSEAESGGGANPTQATQPAFVAREFIRCICSVPRL